VATNVFLTDDIITLEGLSILENELVAKKLCTMKYEALFGPHGGSNRSDVIRVRKPNLYTVRTGRTFSAQNIEDQYTTMTVDTQIGVDTEIYSDELKQDLSSFSDQVIRPQMTLLANYIDAAILTEALKTPNIVGTPGVVPSALSTFLAAGVKLDQNAAPRDGQRHMVLGPQMQADSVDALKGLYNSQSKVSKQFESGEMEDVAGFKWSMTQNLASYTTGPQGGTPLVSSAPANEATTLVTKGWTASASSRLVVNDVFTIAGVYSVNPVNKVSTGVLQQFRVTAAFSSDGSGNGSVSVYPSFNFTANAKQNISAQPAVDAAISVVGAPSTLSAQGIAAHKGAIALAFCPLPKPEGVHEAATKTDRKTGYSLRFVRWYDGDNDLWKARFDVKFGVDVLRPEWVVRVASGAA
jgi:hypothetical protein